MTKSITAVIDGVVNKKCGTCGEMKPVALFHRRGDGRDGYRSDCKACWTEKYREASNACHARKNKEDPERYRAQRSRAYIRARGDFTACMRMALHVRRRQCEERGIEFDITAEDIAQIYEAQNGKCILTGRELLWGLAGWHRDTLSIDRIEASRGYVDGNVRLITYQANRARSDLSDGELFRFCEAVLFTCGIQVVTRPISGEVPIVNRPSLAPSRLVMSAENLEI